VTKKPHELRPGMLPFKWPKPEHRKSYDEVWRNYCDGLFSAGFMWELAKHDEVFKAFVVKKGLQPL